MNRLLILLFVSSLFACQPSVPYPDDGTSKWQDRSKKPFYHSVASGDPLSDRVIIWTRVTPEYKGEISVKWEMASDEGMKEIVKQGAVVTDSTRDYTVKVDVDGLSPSTFYYYQFEALGVKSDVGRTKTASTDGDSETKFAIVSCSNFEAGYFNAFGRIAEKELDAVLHLGDYIYEYGIAGYGDTTLGRLNLPAGEILTLSDYRTRYSLYRLDKDFQAAHRNHPFITIWDDHEIANNAYKSGAQNHQEDEGDFEQRKAVAAQVYYEWLPIRENGELYRKFDFGNLVDLIMLDERVTGRTAPADSTSQPDFRDASRTMLGETQRKWFLDNLANSDATWKVVGNQVIFSDLNLKAIYRNTDLNLDAWDGYPYEKELIINFLKENNIQNTVFVTGDTHSSWAFETPTSIEDYQKDSVNSVVAIEFGTTSISSANSDESYPVDKVIEGEQVLLATNPHLKYANRRDHGYLLLTLDSARAKAEWYFVDTVKKPSKKESIGKKIEVKKNELELF